MTTLNINNIVRRIIAEEFGDEIEPNKLIKIDDSEYYKTLQGYNDMGVSFGKIDDFKMNLNDIKLANKYLTKIKTLYPDLEIGHDKSYISIEIPSTTLLNLKILIHKIKEYFYIEITLPEHSWDGTEYYKIKSTLDIVMKKIMSIIFMNAKV